YTYDDTAPTSHSVSSSPVALPISHGKRRFQLFAFPDSRDEIGEVPVRHGVRSPQVRGRRCAAHLELIRLVPFEVVDFIAIAIHNIGRASCRDVVWILGADM